MPLFSSRLNFGIILLGLSVLTVDSAIAQGATVPSTEKLAQSQVVAMATDAVSTTREDSLEGAIA
ncbi:MAG: hypothetical protein WBB82_00225, partial [Limnothrix sp.]